MEIKKTSRGGKALNRGYEILLFFVTFLWGTTFVAQSVAMDDMPPFAYVFARFLVSAVILLFVTLGRSLLLKRRKRAETETEPVSFRQTILGGLITGLALFAASISQQVGLVSTTVGEASFINTFYIILVPVAGTFLGIKATGRLWVGVAISLVGLYLISVDQGLHMSTGNAYVLLGAVLFTVQILAIDHFSVNADLMWYAVIEFFVIAALSLILSLLFEKTGKQGGNAVQERARDNAYAPCRADSRLLADRTQCRPSDAGDAKLGDSVRKPADLLSEQIDSEGNLLRYGFRNSAEAAEQARKQF